MKSLIKPDRLNILIGEAGGLSKFCRLNGITRNVVCRVLRGEGEFLLKTVMHICQNGDASIDWLIGRTEERRLSR